MGRRHLFEFGDQPWLPAFLRDAMTSYLTFAMRLTGHDKLALAPVVAAVRDSGADTVLDLAAGAGGITDPLVQALEAEGLQTRVLLADLFPNQDALKAAAAHPRVEAVLEPQDARAVPADRKGLRLMVNAFHHLQPDDARQVLASAHAAGQPIVILELVGREAPFILGMFFTPLGSTLTAPFWKPFRLTNLLFTWLFPVLQGLIAFDGVVSCLRVYDEAELKDLTQGLDDFTWRVERPELGNPRVRATALVGLPR